VTVRAGSAGIDWVVASAGQIGARAAPNHPVVDGKDTLSRHSTPATCRRHPDDERPPPHTALMSKDLYQADSLTAATLLLWNWAISQGGPQSPAESSDLARLTVAHVDNRAEIADR